MVDHEREVISRSALWLSRQVGRPVGQNGVAGLYRTTFGVELRLHLGDEDRIAIILLR